MSSFKRGRRLRLAGAILAASLAGAAASENAPRRPFAYWADIPSPGQFIVGAVYEESEAYHMWAAGNRYNITVKDKGENYGIDINQGYVSAQYGIAERWAADLSVGGTSSGWRSFSPDNRIKSTTGVMDISFGVRYQIFNEAAAQPAWLPTLTFRAGAVVPGSFDESFPFAPGLRSTAIEPGLLLRKHFAWPGLGAYGDALYRWNRTTGNDQYIIAFGLFQQIKGWELAAGYRHLQTTSGTDISYNPALPASLDYPRDPREISESIEAGFSYTTSKRHLRYAFHSRTVFDGNNTDKKFWVGASIDVPLGGKHPADQP